jgi:sugar lactone lactonase YvrE
MIAIPWREAARLTLAFALAVLLAIAATTTLGVEWLSALSRAIAPGSALIASDVLTLLGLFGGSVLAAILVAHAEWRAQPHGAETHASRTLALAAFTTVAVLIVNAMVLRARPLVPAVTLAAIALGAGILLTAWAGFRSLRADRRVAAQLAVVTPFALVLALLPRIFPYALVVVSNRIDGLPHSWFGLSIGLWAEFVRSALQLLAGLCLLAQLLPWRVAAAPAAGRRRRGVATAAAGLALALGLVALQLRAPFAMDRIVALPEGGSARLAFGLHDGYRQPDGLAWHPEHGLVVADEARQTVTTQRPGEAARVWVSASEGLRSPESVAVTADGAILVSDDLGQRVLRVREPRRVEVLAIAADGLVSPEGLSQDLRGSVFVGDEGNGSIWLLEGGGIHRFAGSGSGLVAPEELRFDPHGRLWVTDDEGGRCFASTPGAAPGLWSRSRAACGSRRASRSRRTTSPTSATPRARSCACRTTVRSNASPGSVMVSINSRG